MKNILTAIAVLAPLALATGARADEYDKIHSVAVVVATGNDITVREMSLLSFEEGTQHFAAKTDIAGTIKRYVETALATRFTVEQAAVDGGALSELAPDAFMAALRQAPLSGPPVDAYVVVSLGFHSFGRIVWSGIGLDLVGDDSSDTALYTHIKVQVIDARSGENIDYGSGKFPHGGPFGGVEPIQICGRALWPESVASMTPAQQNLIETEVMAAIKAIIPNMLDNANLPTATGYTLDSHSGDALGTGICHRP